MDSAMKKMKLYPYLLPHTEINQKGIKKLNIRL